MIAEFDFPAFVKESNISDLRLDRKLPLSLFLKHEGYRFKVNEEDYEIRLPKDKDRIIAEFSTYLGICGDARHYYGELVLPLPSMTNVKEGYISAGYRIPLMLHRVELHRKIYEEEINEDFDRYKRYKNGDWIYGFNSKEDVMVRAREVVETYFPGFRIERES